jgi:hypothetical protein
MKKSKDECFHENIVTNGYEKECLDCGYLWGADEKTQESKPAKDAKEILIEHKILKKTSDGKYFFCESLYLSNLLKTMEQYRSEGLRKELIKFCDGWIIAENNEGSPKTLTSAELVDEYLKQKP